MAQISFTHPSLNEQWELGSTQNIVIENLSGTNYTGCYVKIVPQVCRKKPLLETIH